MEARSYTDRGSTETHGKLAFLRTGARLRVSETPYRARGTIHSLNIPAGGKFATSAPMLVDASFNLLTRQIIGAAVEVHRVIGPGLLESTYMPCLQYELAARKLRFTAERAVPVVYKEIPLDTQYRIDLIVEEAVIVELKSVEQLLPVHQAQVLTYICLTGCPAGLLINFNVPKLIDGVKRLINPRR